MEAYSADLAESVAPARRDAARTRRPSGKLSAADPFTLAVIQASLAAVGEEMFVALKKTAMSAIIYEVLDMGTGITDPEGQLAASGCGIPTFMAVIDKAVQRLIALRGTDDLRSGDIFILNDPYFGAVTHLNDVALIMPVFADRRLVAWVGNIAHWPDVGGATPGSMSSEAAEIWQEGLRLPAVRLFAAGAPVAPVFDILMANTRLPDALRGDLWAGVAAVRIGERRIREIVGRYGHGAFAHALADYMAQGERASRAGLRALPQGVFERVDRREDGSIWKVRIEIGEESFTVDLRDNPDQGASPFNLSRDGTTIAAQMLFKAVTGPHSICNGGAFRPLVVKTRPGSIFEPLPPAPHGYYFETRIRLYDLLWRCLAEAMPGRLPAGHFASICSTVLSGIHPDTGRPYTVVEPQVGGWGASSDHDGVNANFSGVHGDTFNCPVEIAEARYGVLVERLGLNRADGGEGRFRGGRGIHAEWRIRAPEAFLSIGYGRAQMPSWGLAQGRDGTANYVEILRGDGTQERLTVATHRPVRRGDVVRIVTGNGGGYGDPAARSRAAVEADLRDGYIAETAVREIYRPSDR
jgi:N-methylhydantoinase B